MRLMLIAPIIGMRIKMRGLMTRVLMCLTLLKAGWLQALIRHVASGGGIVFGIAGAIGPLVAVRVGQLVRPAPPIVLPCPRRRDGRIALVLM